MISKSAAKKLLELYLAQELIIYLRDMNVVTVDDNGNEMRISPMVQGFCIDIDQEFYYLGLPDGTITRTIGHDVAQMVEISFQDNGTIYDLDFPANEEDVH